MRVTIQYAPSDSQAAFWEIPDQFKQQVFEFLESLENQKEEESPENISLSYKPGKETTEGRRTYLETLIEDSIISNTIKRFFLNLDERDSRHRGNFREILKELYNSAYENGKQV